jgi:hypothetical protein
MRHNWIDEMGIPEHDVSLGVKKVFYLISILSMQNHPVVITCICSSKPHSLESASRYIPR